MRKRTAGAALTFAALLALTSLLAACGTTGKAAALLDTEWELVELNGQDAVPGALVSMKFNDDDHLNGTGGCNRFMGNWEHSGSNELSLSAGGSTMMACEESLMTQETGFFQALEDTARYSRDGSFLNLYNGDNQKIAGLTRLEPSELTRTSWEVVGFNNGQQAVVSVLENSTLLATFDPDDTVSGQSGCNTFTGDYSRGRDGTLKIGELAMTLMACDQPIMDQEAQFLAALKLADTYELGKGSLDLRAKDGSLLVMFREAN